MHHGAKPLRTLLTLALLAAAAGEAWATKLDKAACNDLNIELTSLLASGLKEDMDRGPEWGAVNLAPDRLHGINRVIELQGQLEFRCGRRPGSSVAKVKPGKTPTADSPPADSGNDAGPAQKPGEKVRRGRRKRASEVTTTEKSAATPATAAKPPAVNSPATAPAAASAPPEASPGPSKTAATTPPATPPELVKTAAPNPLPPASDAKKSATLATPAAAAAAPSPAADQAPAPASAARKAAARRKASRRDSSSAYVSPQDVDPFSMTTGGK